MLQLLFSFFTLKPLHYHSGARTIATLNAFLEISLRFPTIEVSRWSSVDSARMTTREDINDPTTRSTPPYVVSVSNTIPNEELTTAESSDNNTVATPLFLPREATTIQESLETNPGEITPDIRYATDAITTEEIQCKNHSCICHFFLDFFVDSLFLMRCCSYSLPIFKIILKL